MAVNSLMQFLMKKERASIIGTASILGFSPLKAAGDLISRKTTVLRITCRKQITDRNKIAVRNVVSEANRMESRLAPHHRRIIFISACFASHVMPLQFS